jgi:long-chain acyl-CoA synthetase
MVRKTNHVSLEQSCAKAGRTVALLAKVVELALTDVDLSLPQYRVLAHLNEGDVAASALAGRLAVSRPSITAVVDGLVARGLVERGGDDSDRRRVTHALTPQGRRAVAEADRAIARKLGTLVSRLGERDARQAIEGLARWHDALSRALAAAAAAS